MKLFNFNKDKKSEDTKSFAIGLGANVSKVELPAISETRRNDWVDLGKDNLFPIELQELYLTSPMNQAIINRKALMMSGSGVEFDEAELLNPAFIKLIEYTDGKNDLECLLKKWSLDYQTYGSYAIEVMWSLDFSKITKIKYVDTANIRSGWMIQNEVKEYWYSENWAKKGKNPPISIAAFDTSDKVHHNQLLYVTKETIGLKYYGMPSWYSAKNSIELETGLTTNYLTDLKSGFSGKVAITFPSLPKTEEEKDAIVKSFNKAYLGESGNRAVILFAPNDTLKPDITKIDNEQVNESWVTINESATQNILTAHGVTSPELFGIAKAGKLGNATIAESYNIFYNTVVLPDQKTLENSINMLFKVNGLSKIKIVSSTPLEIIDDSGSAIDKEKSYNGAQISSAVEIMQNVNEGILTEDQAIKFLIQMLGFSEEEAYSLFGKSVIQ